MCFKGMKDSEILEEKEVGRKEKKGLRRIHHMIHLNNNGTLPNHVSENYSIARSERMNELDVY
jgi:hypothetical protein